MLLTLVAGYPCSMSLRVSFSASESDAMMMTSLSWPFAVRSAQYASVRSARAQS